VALLAPERAETSSQIVLSSVFQGASVLAMLLMNTRVGA